MPWKTQGGEAILLQEMTDKHLLNMHNYLQKRIKEAEDVRDKMLGEPQIQTDLLDLLLLGPSSFKHLNDYRRYKVALNYIESDTETLLGIEVQIYLRKLTPGKFPKGPSPLTKAEIDYIFYRLKGWDTMIHDEQTLTFGGEDCYPLEVSRYSIAEEMRLTPVTEEEELHGGWLPR